MPIANIYAPPSEDTQAQWDFNHYQDHLQIVQAIAAQLGVNLPMQPIWPRGNDHGSWSRLHQQLHQSMSNALGTPASDLTTRTPQEMDSEWIFRNFEEHNIVRKILGI